MIGRFRPLVLLVAVLASGPAAADLKLPPHPRSEPPMHFLRAKAVDPACTPDCPEWLSAEGRIAPGSGAAFAKAVAALGGRRVPILLSSRGGSVRDAVEMGLLIRREGLIVAIARTQILDCPESNPSCPQGRAVATVGGSVCASACPLILAGGVERIAGAAAEIGVHQITTEFRQPTGAAGLITTRRIYEDRGADNAVDRYFAAMGIGEPVMALLRKTPAASIRWLSGEEIRQARIATATLDAAEPVVMAGANGLNLRDFDGAPAGLVTARATSLDEPGAEVSLAYRIGGGALALTLSATGGARWSLRLGDGAPQVAPGHPATAIVSRAAFCALGPNGRIVASRETKEAGAPAEIAFALAEMSGWKGLFAAACP